jgi:hypothetical protein
MTAVAVSAQKAMSCTTQGKTSFHSTFDALVSGQGGGVELSGVNQVMTFQGYMQTKYLNINSKRAFYMEVQSTRQSHEVSQLGANSWQLMRADPVRLLPSLLTLFPRSNGKSQEILTGLYVTGLVWRGVDLAPGWGRKSAELRTPW